MDDTFAGRLKWALEKSGMKPTDLSSITGIGKSSISRYLKGEYIPKQKKLTQIATVLNVSEGWLLTGVEQKATSAKGVRIPVLGRVAAGIPISAITDIEDWEEIPESMAKSGEYFALRIKGQSMEPRICDGDVVIVKQQPCVDSGDVAIVLVNGDEATVKEIKMLDSGIMLIGWNTAVYSPRFYSKADTINLPVKIIGKVVELRGKF